jgi:hypothetical protein
MTTRPPAAPSRLCATRQGAIIDRGPAAGRPVPDSR